MALVLFGLAGLGLGGRVGGQSGTEGLCGESDGKRDENPFATESFDEDGGVEDPDAGDRQLTAGDGPEAHGASAQCLSDRDRN